MRKSIFNTSDLVRQSSLSKNQYQINGNELKFHPFGHSNGSYEAIITFRSNGAIGNYFGNRYRNIFEALKSININPKSIGWINEK